MAANDPSVARRDLLIRIRWLLWGAVFLLAVVAAVVYGVHRRAAPKTAAVAAVDAPGGDLGGGHSSRTRLPPHRPARQARVARGVTGPPGARHVHRPALPELLPDRGAAPERRRERPAPGVEARDRGGQRQHLRQRALDPHGGCAKVEARARVAVGDRESRRSWVASGARTTWRCSTRPRSWRA